MRNRVGVFCMVMGTALLLGALFLFVHNKREAAGAESAIMEVMPQLIEEIEVSRQEQETEGEEPPITPGKPVELLTPEEVTMAEVEINGYSYIGYLSVPVLGLDLPVMADWTYRQLAKAPCRYSGTVRGEDLVVMAHNYARHFGKLSELKAGDSVTFTDVHGKVSSYEVVARDVLAPTAVEEMTAGTYDLALFTCNYSGSSRITVFCNLVK